MKSLNPRIFSEILRCSIPKPSLFINLQEPVFCDDVGLSGRFVMIADDALRNQQTFTYRNRQGLPSPLEFLEFADVLRRMVRRKWSRD
jgi:hypothetical protein